jgi:putative phosphoribosyl transferase
MTFASRQDAGEKLGRYLQQEGVAVDIVLGLPRGGVIVAAEVAHILQRPLDVLVVRKIGHPLHREYAVGALAEEGVVLLDPDSLTSQPLAGAKLDTIIHEETERLWQYQLKFHRDGRRKLSGKIVLIVDDGLATGATTEAAVLSARKQGALVIVVAAPVASMTAVGRLEQVADDVLALRVDPKFEAVGSYYKLFSQTTDEEVMDVLKAEHVV